MTDDAKLVETLSEDFRRFELEKADLAMLTYADKLTREPWNMTEQDVNAVRGAGFDDRAILDICQIAAYFAFVNRLADGLGVELEEHLRNSQ